MPLLRVSALATGFLAVPVWADGGPVRGNEDRLYVVLAKDGASLDAVQGTVVAAGGVVTGRNDAVGMLTARSARADFPAAVSPGVNIAGLAVDRSIGSAPRRLDAAKADVEAARASLKSRGNSVADRRWQHAPSLPGAEPLANLQWNMRMIGATPDGSYAVEQGNRQVTVGVIDTGVDGKHPDIRPNFSRHLSRNFVTDRADLGDGEECEIITCIDPVDVDENGHGTQVAGIIGAAINGFGIAGVAPRVTLVNLRAGQDSGYFLLSATVNALTYAADAGIDVVNMSFYVDPWAFNCPANPADSLEARWEQRTVITLMRRALRYARTRGVTLVGALGNSHFDYDNISRIVDATSPDFPFQVAYPRPLQPNCVDLPVMGYGVIGTIALGPTGTKADYSNWSMTYGEVSAPGGWLRDFLGTPNYLQPTNLILAPYPKNVGIAAGTIDPNTGESLDPLVLRTCRSSECAYYEYQQGTSMAAPHAAGVAALIVSRYGKRESVGFGLNPDKVSRTLFSTATDISCPTNPVIDYRAQGRDASFTATCTGTSSRNNIYGRGLVNALAAVLYRERDENN